ncbi:MULTISPECIES: energy transducer TonB [Roseobacteraceae]|uniref:cell envelope integrity protein TolA n=1 Tax=Roseobacteraceae TaxID=2854170 RepID=UPI003296F325
MIAGSKRMAVFAFTVAAGAHLGGLNQWGLTDPVQIAGGQANGVQASLGDAFADLTAGTISPVEAIETSDVVHPTEATKIATVAPTTLAQRLDIETQVESAEPRVAATDVRAPQPITHRAVVQTPQKTLAAVTPLPATPARPEPQTLKPLPVIETPPAVDPTDAPPETITATTPETSARAPSLRPKKRPAFVQKRTAKAQPRQQSPARAGGQTNARAGQSDGAKDAPANRATSGQSATAQPGNAAVSSYPGKVMRKIQRVRRPRVGTRGTAVIAFRVASNGGLGGLSVARSSGSDRLDKAAMQVIQRAAPFPTPPPGAKRAFSIQINGQ